MENKLRNLKGKMDETIFNDLTFNQKHQENVLNSIKVTDFKKKEVIFKDKFNLILSIAVTSCLFLGMGYFVGTKTHLLNGGQGIQHKEGSRQDTKVNKTSYTPARQEENYNDMTKEDVLNKMLNTIHNFETAKGQFKVNFDRTSSDYILVDYDISLNHNVGYYERERNSAEHTDRSLAYNDSSVYMIDNDYRLYKGGKGGGQKPGQKPILDGLSERSLFPDFIANALKKNPDTWEIEKQNEMVLGHNTIVLKGKYDVTRESNFSFRYWVDKDTGILLKEEVYNSSGKIVDYLYPTKLEINVPVDSKEFIPNLEEYQQTDDMDLERMKRDNQPHMLTGNIDYLVPQELKKKWEQAKKKPNETSMFHLNEYWFIYVKEGYSPDKIDNDGVLHLTKSPPQKSKGNYGVWAIGYHFDSLKIVYDN